MEGCLPDDSMPNLGYEPVWTYDGPEGRFGFTVDDGCYVALTMDADGCWNAVPHVPVLLLRTMFEHMETMGARYRA